jgi:hypothetical protein
LEDVVDCPVADGLASSAGNPLATCGNEFQNVSTVDLVQERFGAGILKHLHVPAIGKPRLVGLVFLHKGKVLGSCISDAVALFAIGVFDFDPSCNSRQSLLAPIERHEGGVRVIAHGVKPGLTIFKPANLVLTLGVLLFFAVDHGDKLL